MEAESAAVADEVSLAVQTPPALVLIPTPPPLLSSSRQANAEEGQKLLSRCPKKYKSVHIVGFAADSFPAKRVYPSARHLLTGAGFLRRRRREQHHQGIDRQRPSERVV